MHTHTHVIYTQVLFSHRTLLLTQPLRSRCQLSGHREHELPSAISTQTCRRMHLYTYTCTITDLRVWREIHLYFHTDELTSHTQALITCFQGRNMVEGHVWVTDSSLHTLRHQSQCPTKELSRCPSFYSCAWAKRILSKKTLIYVTLRTHPLTFFFWVWLNEAAAFSFIKRIIRSQHFPEL